MEQLDCASCSELYQKKIDTKMIIEISPHNVKRPSDDKERISAALRGFNLNFKASIQVCEIEMLRHHVNRIFFLFRLIGQQVVSKSQQIRINAGLSGARSRIRHHVFPWEQQTEPIKWSPPHCTSTKVAHQKIKNRGRNIANYSCF